jgi:AP2-associated kinase
MYCQLRGFLMLTNTLQIYANRTESEDRRNQQLPPITPNIASPPIVGAVYSPPVPQLAVIPDVVPMRRGRPTTNSQPVYAKSSNASLHGITSDPFAALDGQPATLTAKDEISARFPSLDQFSLLHDKGAKFEFETTTPHMPTTTKALNQRVTERLADEAFVTPVVPAKPSTVPQPAPGVTGGTSRAQQIITSNPALQVAISAPSAPQHTPAVVPGASRAQQIIANNPALQEAMSAPSAPSTNTISRQPTTMSQGTMTDLPSEPPTQAKRYTPSPIYRFPPADHHRSTSLPRSGAGSSSTEMRLRPDPILSRKDSIGRETNSASQPNLSTKQALSSRPSLEGGRPSSDFLETAARPHAIEPRVRPVTAYVESNLDYLRDKESAPAKSGFLHRHGAPQQVPTHAEGNGNRSDESDNVESEVEFLRQMEDDGRKDRRRNSGDKSAKRTSLPSISLSGTKNLLSGRFGDAFKRFENNGHSTSADQTHSPEQGLTRRELTPIAGSEATDGRSDDGHVLEETDDMSPEMKRELERRRLSMEERRVEAAAAEYRKRLAERPPGGDARSLGGMTKAASIQQKVQNLLDDNSKPSLVKKTAEGYGKYTDTASNSQSRMYAEKTTIPSPKPIVARKPIDVSAPYLKPATQTIPITQSLPHRAATIASRPTAPPKPTHLNALPTGCAPMLAHALSNSPPKPRRIEPRMDMTQAERDDYISEFSKRFPSLTSIDMVETDVSTAPLNGGAGRGI